MEHTKEKRSQSVQAGAFRMLLFFKNQQNLVVLITTSVLLLLYVFWGSFLVSFPRQESSFTDIFQLNTDLSSLSSDTLGACRVNMLIKENVISTQEWISGEVKAEKWHKNLMKMVRILDGKKTPEFVQVLIPTINCSKGLRLGIAGDEGKVICGLELLAKRDCLVYSLGSNGHWEFEMDMYKQTTCRMETFDCFHPTPIPTEIASRTQFHEICIGEDQIKDGKIFKSLPSLMKMLNHTHVDILKIDIETAEWNLFWELFEQSTETNLPDQILVELHWGNDWAGWPRRNSGEMGMLLSGLYKAGYRLSYLESNPTCPNCYELSYLRMKC